MESQDYTDNVYQRLHEKTQNLGLVMMGKKFDLCSLPAAKDLDKDFEWKGHPIRYFGIQTTRGGDPLFIGYEGTLRDAALYIELRTLAVQRDL